MRKMTLKIRAKDRVSCHLAISMVLTMTFRSSLLSALVNIRNLVPSFSIIVLQALVHWRSKKSEKSHKLLSDLSGMVTQFNKISSPVSLFFLQGKFLSMLFFIELKNTEHSQLLKIPIIFWQLFYVTALIYEQWKAVRIIFCSSFER